MSSKGVVKAMRTCSLGSGWYIMYDFVTAVGPSQSAVADLDLFYNGINNNAGSQLYDGARATIDLAFSFSHYPLRFSSADPINWA